MEKENLKEIARLLREMANDLRQYNARREKRLEMKEDFMSMMEEVGELVETAKELQHLKMARQVIAKRVKEKLEIIKLKYFDHGQE